MNGFLEALSLGMVLTFAAILLYAAASDYRHYLIPNRAVIAVAGAFAIFIAAQLALPAEARIVAAPLSHLGKGVILALVVFAGTAGLFAAGVMGGGDVKLLTAVTLWAGMEWTAFFLLVTAVAGGLVTLAVLLRARWRRRTASPNVNPLDSKMTELKVPYGLGICVGGLMVAYALAERAPLLA